MIEQKLENLTQALVNHMAVMNKFIEAVSQRDVFGAAKAEQVELAQEPAKAEQVKPVQEPAPTPTVNPTPAPATQDRTQEEVLTTARELCAVATRKGLTAQAVFVPLLAKYDAKRVQDIKAEHLNDVYAELTAKLAELGA